MMAAAHVNAAQELRPPPFRFEGTRIGAFGPLPSPSSSQPCYVAPGAQWEDWKSVTGKEVGLAHSAYTYEVYIDDEPVKLRKWVWQTGTPLGPRSFA